MKTLRSGGLLVLGGLLAAAALAGCSSKLKNVIVPDIPPTVTLTSAPYDTTGRYFYAYKLDWLGNDPDGRVVNFIYAIDPKYDGVLKRWIPRGGWTVTTKNEQIIFFTASHPDSTNPKVIASDFHTFAIAAIDDRAETSLVVTRSFFSYTVAPSVHILNPKPSGLLTHYVTPSVRITWDGQDPDGQFTQKPVKYKFKLFSQSDPFFNTIKSSGGLDSLRNDFAPRFAGWDSSSAETLTVQYTNLTPNAEYIFALTSFDEAGAYTPTFSYDSNVLDMRATIASSSGPIMTMFNEFFQFTFVPSYNPTLWTPLEVPYKVPITFNWTAVPDPGADIAYYRWRLGGDVSDETPRSNENTDITHWSAPSLGTISATIGPFPSDSVTFFYLEGTDNNGLKTLASVYLHVVKPTFNRDLGVVNDTRYSLDVLRIGTSIYVPPGGAWPTAAEFDTFMFARGGAPYQAYPAGTISKPGIFNGYDFDTVTTRTGKSDLTVPLSVLGKYRHLIWITDSNASAKTMPGSVLGSAMCALRYMNDNNRVNTLGTYIKEGGQVWLLGSGIAHACQINFDKDGNAGGYYADGRELIPGRFMWDVVHWQDNIDDFLGAGFEFHRAPRAVSNPYFNIDYSMLPDTLRRLSLANGDSMPPNRVSGFYPNLFGFSQVSLPNYITENIQFTTPKDTVLNISTLDTLYNVVYPGVEPRQQFPISTYYHGMDQSTGYTLIMPVDLWEMTRSDCIAFVDFVCQGLWGIQRTAGGAAARPYASATRSYHMPPTHGATRALLSGGVKHLLAAPGARPKE